MWGYTDVIKFLAQNGAKLDLADKRGLTPLDAAMGLAGGLGFDGKSGAVREGNRCCPERDSRRQGRVRSEQEAGGQPARGRSE
jgi:hypothetical protein